MRKWNPLIGKFRQAKPEYQIAKLGKQMDELLEDMLGMADDERERQVYELQYLFHQWHPLMQELITNMCKRDDETAKEWKRLLDTASINITNFNTNVEMQNSLSKGSMLISKLSNQEISNTISRILSIAIVLLEHREEPAVAKKIVKNTMFYSFSEMKEVLDTENELNRQNIQEQNNQVAQEIKQEQKLDFIE